MNTMIRKLAARRNRAATPALPALTTPCTDCGGTGEIYNDAVEEHFKAEEAAEKAYDEANPNSPLGFYGSYEYEFNWKNRQPPEFLGCPECDYTGEKLTPAGQQIVAFMRARGVKFGS